MDLAVCDRRHELAGDVLNGQSHERLGGRLLESLSGQRHLLWQLRSNASSDRRVHRFVVVLRLLVPTKNLLPNLAGYSDDSAILHMPDNIGRTVNFGLLTFNLR